MVKAGERQWCDVGIFKNNTALVSQFYLLPKGKQSISKVAIDVFSTLLVISLKRGTLRSKPDSGHLNE